LEVSVTRNSGAGELQRGADQSDQDLVQRARGVQLARGVEEHGQFFQVAGLVLDLHHRDLAEEFAGRAGMVLLRIEDQVGAHAHAELDAVVAQQLPPLHPVLVHIGAQLAAAVHDVVVPLFTHDLGMVAGDAWIGDLQVFPALASDGEGRQAQDHLPLFGAMDEQHNGKPCRFAGACRR